MQRSASNASAAPANLCVGVLVNNVGGYSRSVIRGIASFAFARAWTCLAEGVNLNGLSDQLDQFDGVIVQAAQRELAQVKRRFKGPVVNVSSAIQHDDTPSVVTDDRAVGRLAAEYFLGRRFRRLVFFSPDQRQFAQLRWSGFDAACRGKSDACQRISDLDELAELLVRSKRSKQPTAVFGCNDRAAIRVLDHCRAAGLAVPEDVAVLGVDNDDLVQSLANPPLSTINTARERIGFEAAALLQNLIEHRPAERLVLVPPSHVHERRSTDVLAVDDHDVATAVHFIDTNAGRRISVDDVAANGAISRRQLERRFKQVMDRTVHDEIRRSQVERARRLLLETDLTLPQIADAAGFNSPAYFNTVFSSEVGVTPGQFREQRTR